MVRESRGKSKYQGAKVNKDAEKSLNRFTSTEYSFARRLFVSPLFKKNCFAALVSSAIAND